jgi:hypothetical protein
MSESLLETFELFFITLPTTVRNDLSFMLIALFDENFLVIDAEDVYQSAARGLFRAKTPIGRIGELICAVSVFDVYFAMDARERYSGPSAQSRKTPRARDGGIRRDPYAEQIDDIEAAKQRWLELRTTRFTPAVVAAALIPAGPPHKPDCRLAALSAGGGKSLLNSPEYRGS